MTMTIDEAAQKIWNYALMHHELKKADVLLVPGHSDIRIMEYAVKLYKEGWAPVLLCSGSGSINKHLPGRERFQDSTEADIFKQIALDMGVSEKAIITETKSQNTGDNLIFSLKRLKEEGIVPKRVIAVMKPYAERRMTAIAGVVCPDVEMIVTSPAISFQEYATEKMPQDYVINMLVGDLMRIKEYPKKGLQIEQQIPADVDEAYGFLISKGYTKRAIPAVCYTGDVTNN